MAHSNQVPQAKHLKDYKRPDFKVHSIYLDFDLHDGHTTAKAKTVFERVNKAAKDLILDAEELELVDISMDGARLAPHRFKCETGHLAVLDVGDKFTLDITTEIFPEQNTSLQGLYRSSGNYCTQCEAESFRKITYYLDRPDVMAKFTTRIEADEASCPVLLSNGNCIDKGKLGNGRHFAVWEDPFVKPAYLFALVAGKLGHVHDTFTTMSGRKVDLYIYVNPGNEDKCAHAMESLKKSMKWDEEKYGCEYDLDLFNIVAVDDFNMGAMENKSLNIFNSKMVLALPETATDVDYHNIESIIGHEYFHNWTGNRITCRDWFQLSLKEGLTVFRDQCFSADMNSEATQRIDDVVRLQAVQFPEDGGPMAHPVRPDNYIEINNFYTPTVYEKGAEVIRMMHTLLGPEKYRKATDLYFKRHDGQAVTCDDFAQCMQDASGIDLSQFKLWYSQAGTPTVKASSHYDADKKTFSVTLEQTIPDTPGQTGKKPMHMPILVGLLGKDGRDLLPEKTRLLQLTDKKQTFTFENIAEKPVPSYLRRFSAPVKFMAEQPEDELLFLMAHDSDGFNRWAKGQAYLQQKILNRQALLPQACIDSFRRLITNKEIDKELLAATLAPPSETTLAQFMDVIDVDMLHDNRKALMTAIGKACFDELNTLYRDNSDTGPYRFTPEAVGRRRLKAIALRYLQAADMDTAVKLALTQYGAAQNMTDKISALGVLGDAKTSNAAAEAYNDFYKTWKNNPIVLDKWFSLQAMADRDDAPKVVEQLVQHEDFTLKNPNRVRALIGSFSNGNPKWFHRADGAGYRLLSDAVIRLNPINPSTAARALGPLRQWRKYDPHRQQLMEAELKRIIAEKELSNDVYEIVSKCLS